MFSKLSIIAIILFVLALVASGIFYTVDERERAIVFKFGEIIRADDKPGLREKVPLINSVKYFDARIQTLDAEPELYFTIEKKGLVVDSFVKWRIVDTKLYFVSVGGLKSSASKRLSQLTNDGLKTEFGKRTVTEVISGDRSMIMKIVRENTNREAEKYGIEVIDVRLKRVDLVKEISQSVYDRMEAERERVAKDYRARGAEAAERLRADADRKSQIIVANAERDAQIKRGEGDAEATRIYAEAYSKDAEFFSFYRSLEAYKNTFKDKNAMMIVDPESEFFKYFKSPAK
ncbi:modulator of FtsH protease HflC [bacterium BMS3Bbin11]|nr:modulator of FtsH protease HflC [bacterium BMS3Abin11]GBE45884.1 modulator of FtsH protease HflC [bacterium BMS3Bbin11]HDH16443.1 protease modulator HflC [Gammaproteobacteria bacterium]HDZ78995.1 protease modulator HflC [Gammaproteobacteria bacterium]